MSFGHCSPWVAGSLNLLLLASKWLLAASPRNRLCTLLHRSADLDRNWYRAEYPRHRRKIPHREGPYANWYIRPAHWRFQEVELWKCYRLVRVWRVVCRADVESAQESALCVGRVEVNLFLCISSVSANSVRRHFGKEGSQTYDFDEALPGVFVSQPSLCHALESQHPACSLLGPRRWFRNKIFGVLYRGVRKSFFGHFGQIQLQAHVGLFQLYPTSLPCRSCNHVENLQAISCCF